ncbi:hypothetical protein Tco_0169270 [Tanacetum coccineum]
MRHGFDLGYKTWVHHGEPDLPPPPPVIDNTRQPQMSDMTALLNDLSYIPPNNEHNEPTQGDIGETSNEPTQATRNEFEELYASANEELYPGCDYVTRLDFMAKFTYFKVKGKLTDSIFNEMLEFFQNVFPISKGYKLPPSYYAIKKTFKTIGLGYESIHACEHDCCLFRGDNNKDLDFCPVCNTSRWKDSNTPGKKVPKKVLRYFPIIPRLQRLYKSSHTAKEMTWHATGKCTEPGKMQHPVDGRAWKNFDTKYPDFAKEPRNVRLGLAADGFNPFGNLSQAYSMWPVILTTYNLPPWLCMKESSFMLTLLIPGPKSPGKDIDVYLRPLIDDLKVLWALKGVETIDVATGQKFNMRAMVLWTINDFPARSSLSGWSGQGYKACPTCNEDTPSVRVLSKTAYVGHRRFLKKPHKWRSSREFNGEIEDGDPPRKFNRDKILAQLDRLPTRLTGKHPSYGGVKIKRNVVVELNWTKRSIFYELEYWSFLTLRHNLDIMHIEKNVLEAILNTLLMNDKSKDTAKARQDLQRLGIQSGLWLGQTKNGKCLKPQAAYSFTPENEKSCQFITGYNGLQRLLPYGLQNYLPDKIAKLIIELCSLFKQISSATLIEDDMLKAQIKVVDILCDLELIYPPALFDIMIHLVIHLPLEALEGGPIRPRWMFPFERYMKKLKGYVRNKAKSEGSIAEGYVAEEVLTFSSHYFWDVTTKFNHPDRNANPPPTTCQFQVFRSVCKSIGLRSVIQFEPQEFMKVKLVCIHTVLRSTVPIPFPKGYFLLTDMKNIVPEWCGSKIRQTSRRTMTKTEFSTTSELFALACGPTWTPISINSCVVDCVSQVRKPNLGGRAAGRLNTRDKTRNLSLKEITDKKGPVPIRFELRDKQTLMPLGDHAAHWSSYIGEVIRGVPLYYPSWLKVPKERKAALITDIGTQFDLRPHMESPDWTEINAGIQQHLQKAYNTNKAAFKAQHWVIDPTTGTYNVEKIRRARPEDITAEEWDKYIQFWNDPRNIARAAQNRQNRAKSTVISRQGSRSLARLRDEMRQSSATQEYPSLIDTFFVAHTVNGEFLRDEDRRIYINHLARRGKQRGHIPGFGRVLPARATAGPSQNSLHKKVDFMMSLFKSDSKYSDMFSQFESGGASGSGGCGDDEESADDQEDEDEDGDGDS